MIDKAMAEEYASSYTNDRGYYYEGLKEGFLAGLKAGSQLDRVWKDYDPGEGCYDDTHEGKWVKRWEPWRYVKDELPKIEVGYKVAVEVCYLNAYQNPCKMECDWNGKDFVYQYFDGKKWIFDKKVSLLGKVFAWRYEVDDWPTLSKEVKE